MKNNNFLIYLLNYFRIHIITHKINFIFSKIIFYFSKKNFSSQIENQYKLIKKNKFLVFNKENGYLLNDKKLILILKKICDFTSKYEDKNTTVNYVKRKNFTFAQHNQSNQKHCDELPDEIIQELKIALLDSDSVKLIEYLYGCYYTAINVRSWIFYPLDNVNDDHIHQHTDGFPTGILKIMFYAGNFDLQPALEIFDENDNKKIDGSDPLVLFDSNKLLHGAKAPLNKERPTIEITLMPRNFKKFDVQQSGFQAGYPVNPFKSINKKMEQSAILYS